MRGARSRRRDGSDPESKSIEREGTRSSRHDNNSAMAAASPAPSHVGWLCKRYFRVNRWSERYFVIKGERIEYYPTIKVGA